MALALGSLAALLTIASGSEVSAGSLPLSEPLPLAAGQDSARPDLSNEQRQSMRRAHLIDTFVFGDADARRHAAERIVQEDATWPDDYRGEFFHALAPSALLAAHAHQIPPSVTLAQAAQESGWGRSSLASRYNNLFGVKASTGRPSITLKSAEVLGGVRVPTRASFEVFESWEHSVEQHGVLLSKPRYQKARDNWTDCHTFIRLVAPIYASDPLYDSRVSTLIRRYDLDRWDHLIVESVDMAHTAPDGRALADASAVE
jgi:flagellum-specific peptidoglycan hydrolase FlgJ